MMPDAAAARVDHRHAGQLVLAQTRSTCLDRVLRVHGDGASVSMMSATVSGIGGQGSYAESAAGSAAITSEAITPSGPCGAAASRPARRCA